MKLLFPLPIVYDGTEARYLQRDGARFVQYLVSQGHEAVKIIIDDGSGYPPPKSPILGIATWEQWCSVDFWKSQQADGLLLYGGLNPRLAPVARAIRGAGIPLALKMDSDTGVLSFPKDFWRQIKTGYHFAHQNHKRLESVFRSCMQQGVRAVRGTNNLKSYLPLFDWITGESDFAVENTKAWLIQNQLEQLAEHTVFLGHPVPDEFKYDSSSLPKRKKILAVALNWENPRKGGGLLSAALGVFLSKRTDYTALIVGKASDNLVNTTLPKYALLAGRMCSLGPKSPFELIPQYQESTIFILSSGSEGSPNVAFEAACCGCSLVFPPEIKQLSFFCESNCGTIAKHRTADAMSKALEKEAVAWDNQGRDAVKSSRHWSNEFHTSGETARLLSLFESKA